MGDIVYYVQNGYHVIAFSLIGYFINNDFRLNIYLFLKLFSLNYYHSFSYLYPNPEYYKWKHMIRLTDNGHIANFMFYFFPHMLPIAHNILFVITTVYYISLYLFNLKDTDDNLDSTLVNHKLQQIHCHMNHTIPYLIILYSIHNNNTDICYYEFNDFTLYYSILWILLWFIGIYIPWIYITGDYVYSTMDKKSPFYIKIITILLVFFLVIMANELGKSMQH
tara:strand:+ start:690 stop:1355 length:666 start_codon:yes stop_codon:yes gene_type:complete